VKAITVRAASMHHCKRSLPRPRSRFQHLILTPSNHEQM
jgi:hypothetical protein